MKVSEGNVWSAITTVLLGLSIVDIAIVGMAIVTFVITTIVNRSAYLKNKKEQELAEEQLRQLRDEKEG